MGAIQPTNQQTPVKSNAEFKTNRRYPGNALAASSVVDLRNFLKLLRKFYVLTLGLTNFNLIFSCSDQILKIS